MYMEYLLNYTNGQLYGITTTKWHLREFIVSARMFNYTNPGYGLSLVDTLWNAGSYRQPLEEEGNPMT